MDIFETSMFHFSFNIVLCCYCIENYDSTEIYISSWLCRPVIEFYEKKLKKGQQGGDIYFLLINKSNNIWHLQGQKLKYLKTGSSIIMLEGIFSTIAFLRLFIEDKLWSKKSSLNNQGFLLFCLLIKLATNWFVPRYDPQISTRVDCL